jgi:hypothetical protein
VSKWCQSVFGKKYFGDSLTLKFFLSLHGKKIKDMSDIEKLINKTNGAWILDPEEPEEGHLFDPKLCHALETIFEGQTVLDLGAGLGWYGRCFLRIKEPMFPDAPAADEKFFKSEISHNLSLLDFFRFIV